MTPNILEGCHHVIVNSIGVNIVAHAINWSPPPPQQMPFKHSKIHTTAFGWKGGILKKYCVYNFSRKLEPTRNRLNNATGFHNRIARGYKIKDCH